MASFLVLAHPECNRVVENRAVIRVSAAIFFMSEHPVPVNNVPIYGPPQTDEV